MLTFAELNEPMKPGGLGLGGGGGDKCVDPQLWLACAGGMVQMPSVHSKVYYFPQGHAEHAHGAVDFGGAAVSRLPALVPCRVAAVKFMADPDTDEVFAKIRLIPLRSSEAGYSEDEELGLGGSVPEEQEKPASFAKTLTQSDANNGGGFSVPRYCAETIFPRLDYSADPPVQTVIAKDVHGVAWKFRHIYRGTPRRHLLTTGWSMFVNQKKLVAGDSIVFLRGDSGELHVGIRRAKRGLCGGDEVVPGWNQPPVPPYGSLPMFLREEESKLMRGSGSGGGMGCGGSARGKGKVRAEDVTEAVSLAAGGQPVEIVYYPRASTPEFCVRAAAVRAAMRVQWCPGMRFKMAFETEDSSRISWFMGTISSVQVADPIRWPHSPWRLLQVTWDEPDLLQNVKRVNPWQVELVSSMPAIHLASFSPPRKKPRIPPYPEFPFEGQLLNPVFRGYPLAHSHSNHPFCPFPDSAPAGIQGARHAQFGPSLSDLHLSHLQSSLLCSGLRRLDHVTPYPPRINTDLTIGNSHGENISCSLSIGTPPSTKKSDDSKSPGLVLFGQAILTEQQMSLSKSGAVTSPAATGNSSLNWNTEKTANISDGSGSAVIQNSPTNNTSSERLQWYRDCQMSEMGLEPGQCKVFIESDNVGRNLDLSVLNSFDGLYGRLSEMFCIEKADLRSRVLYRGGSGEVKHAGDESFSEFVKSAWRITILTDAGSDNLGS